MVKISGLKVGHQQLRVAQTLAELDHLREELRLCRCGDGFLKKIRAVQRANGRGDTARVVIEAHLQLDREDGRGFPFLVDGGLIIDEHRWPELRRLDGGRLEALPCQRRL